jgi:alpha-tubulin suppressor-like RCC1 family protein
VAGLTGFTKIAAGSFHNLALRSDGTVWAWGDNQYGQLGDGRAMSRLTPVQVVPLGSH